MSSLGLVQSIADHERKAGDDEDTALTPVLTRTSSVSELAELPINTTEETKNGFQRQNSWALPSASALHSTAQVAVYVWGRGDMHQLGTSSNSAILQPEAPEALQRDVIHAAGNVYNSAWLTVDGDLFVAGNNDSGQLGIKGSAAVPPESVRVAAFDSLAVRHVSMGMSHTMAILRDGMLATWGSNEYGQLGQGDTSADVHSTPRLVKRSRDQLFVRVAAGEFHSLCLTSSGQVMSYGSGEFGALGHGDTINQASPKRIDVLWANGIVQIASGEHHSAALSASGRLYTWGRGKYGQLGVGSFNDQLSPQHVQALPIMVQVACGGDHTLALSGKGELYSWGRGTWGATGLGFKDNVCLPQRVQALEHEYIIQVSAGARHSLALSRQGVVWAFGLGEMGQLGLGDFRTRLSPQPLRPFGAGVPLFVVAAGDHSIAVTRSGADAPSSVGPADQYGAGLAALSLPSLPALAEAAASDGPQAMALLRHAIEDMFASPGFLVACVAASKSDHQAQELSHGLDLAAISRLYTSLLRVYDTGLIDVLSKAAGRLADHIQAALGAPQSPQLMDERNWMRALFVLLHNPLNGESMGKQIVQKLSRAVAASGAKKLLIDWLGELPAEVLGVRILRPLQKYLTAVARRQTSLAAREELLRGLGFLSLVHIANEQAGRKLQQAEFYSPDLCDSLNLQQEYILWVQFQDSRKEQRLSEPVSVCQTPFVLTAEAKSKLLAIEAFISKSHHVQSGSIQALVQGLHPVQLQFLNIRVRRNNLLEDALTQIIMRPNDIKKPLRVTFIGPGGVPEEGLDQGGVTKEFFQLLVRAIFSEDYGLFKHQEETRTWWFSILAVDPSQESEFRLIGSILGLAVYSGVILNCHFPGAVYKKLLRGPLSFEDLKQAFPALGKGLQSLLDYEGDVENTFMHTFEVSYDYYGQMRTHALKPGGADLPVTAHNRQEYVDLYTKWILHDSIAPQFSAFAVGFYEACGGPALTLFHSEELELLICGLPHLDFYSLESAGTRYEGGYYAEHPTIKAFWSTLHTFTLEQKKKFLFFCTGCDRAPVGGLEQLDLVIQRSEADTNRLPTTHTCFNTLLLPEYKDATFLRQRLLIAINNAEGFGLQ